MCEIEAKREKFKDAKLLALKIKEGPQAKECSSRKKGNDSSLEPPKEMQALSTP